MARTTLPDARISPRFAGISTFFRYPRLEDVGTDGRPVDWVIFGVPFDAGVTYRPGARFGPRAVRDASQYVKRASLHYGIDLCDRFSLADAGDAPISPYDAGATLDQVADYAASVGDDGTRTLAVGGDHSIAYANIRATYMRRGEPAGGLPMIHFDAHLDTADQIWGNRWGHASPFRRAIEEGLVNPARMISIGIRGPLNALDDAEFARKAGVTIITADELRSELGPAARARLTDFVRQVAGAEAYVSFDIDAVDPAYAPGTGTPCAGGFTSAEAIDLLRSLRGIRLAGADLVEVLPDRDPAGITALLASHLIFEILCLDAAGRAAGT